MARTLVKANDFVGETYLTSYAKFHKLDGECPVNRDVSILISPRLINAMGSASTHKSWGQMIHNPSVRKRLGSKGNENSEAL